MKWIFTNFISLWVLRKPRNYSCEDNWNLQNPYITHSATDTLLTVMESEAMEGSLLIKASGLFFPSLSLPMPSTLIFFPLSAPPLIYQFTSWLKKLKCSQKLLLWHFLFINFVKSRSQNVINVSLSVLKSHFCQLKQGMEST